MATLRHENQESLVFPSRKDRLTENPPPGLHDPRHRLAHEGQQLRPKKVPYGAGDTVVGSVYEEVKEEIDQQGEIMKLERTNEIKVLRRQQRRNASEINRIQNGSSSRGGKDGKGSKGAKSARSAAQQTTRGGIKPPRTPVGGMSGGHAPRPSAHAHH